YAEAFEYFRESAEIGISEGMISIGTCCFFGGGDGVPRNWETTFKCYHLALPSRPLGNLDEIRP
ncbi:hypothetical protein, partial [Alistipes finegoldii]|uniref:hypothetical protein n=1 Tax=Alistipes finegoldii TaxID=214856 RepID=UPI003AB2E901